VRWVASLFLSRLRVGWNTGEATVGKMGQTGIPVNTKRTAVRDYGFPVWLGSPVMALVCPIWLRGMAGWLAALLMWLVIWSADGLDRLQGGFLWKL